MILLFLNVTDCPALLSLNYQTENVLNVAFFSCECSAA